MSSNRLLCIVLAAVMAGFGLTSRAQRFLTIENAIEIGKRNSLEAMLARHTLMSYYWSYRSFRAQLLPSVNLGGKLLEFNRSVVETRDYETGEINMVNNNTMTNYLSLSVNQNVVPLGGTLSLQSYLYRLDQYSYDKKLYNSQPFRISYNQPLRAFNALKWGKKTEPMKFERANRAYIETMEDVTLQAVSLFFSVLSAQSSYNQSVASLKDKRELYHISEQRHELGTVNKSELLQLKLSLLNLEVETNQKKIDLQSQRFRLFTFLRITENTDISLISPDSIPSLIINQDDVVSKALANSQHVLSQQLTILEAEKSLKQAKAAKGLQMSLYGELGLSKAANRFRDIYNGLGNSEIVGLTFSLPIFDWGVGKGREKMARSELEATKVRMEIEREKYIENLQTLAVKFNMQSEQCRNALEAKNIAEERYGITLRRFEAGGITVTDLNTAQTELELARNQYLAQLRSFWDTYYTLRRSTLYDWINRADIEVDVDKIIEESR